MTTTLILKQQGHSVETEAEFEKVADSPSLQVLHNQLNALDSSLFKEHPVMVLLNSPDNFEIFSGVAVPITEDLAV